ncbi:tail fiber assembly protein, partial [Salmonella enterica subsp. enterica serovar Montevideo]|nr:tail fiber assembly protein [Salmonella enterica subsp. enterica serovar Montevideo]
SISLIQLKLQAGRKLTQAETTRLNAVLDYIDAVTATDTSTAPKIPSFYLTGRIATLHYAARWAVKLKELVVRE